MSHLFKTTNKLILELEIEKDFIFDGIEVERQPSVWVQLKNMKIFNEDKELHLEETEKDEILNFLSSALNKFIHNL